MPRPPSPPQRSNRSDRPQQRASVAPLPANLPSWPGVARIVLRPGTATPVLSGHPWIFSGAIAHILPPPEGELVPGGACAVFDPHGRYLGYGYYNAASQIAVRVVEPGVDGLEPRSLPDAAALVRDRLRRAAALRRDLGLPSATTSAFRLVNSEGDGLPGLTIDRFADGAVVQISSAGASLWQPHVVAALRSQEHGCAWVHVRVPTDIHPSEGLIGGNSENSGDVPPEVVVHHNGLLLRVEPAGGQKTGMYCDQRDNHARVAELAKGRFVLDTYCHTGGFGLHAARAGAQKVVAVDASQRAVDLANTHATDNDLPAFTAQAADAIHVLRHYADLPEDGERPSLIVVDPPKFVARHAALEQGLKKYTHVFTVAMQAMAQEGFLVACSCSGLVDRQTFQRLLGQAAHNAGRTVQLLELRSAAADHPVAPAHAEGSYLKVALCRVSGRLIS